MAPLLSSSQALPPPGSTVMMIGPTESRTVTMKDGIHPEYYVTQVSCGCGNKFTTRSTRKELKVDICNVCHPFYTGKLKFVDTAGRIEKFKNKFAAAGYASLKRGKK